MSGHDDFAEDRVLDDFENDRKVNLNDYSRDDDQNDSKNGFSGHKPGEYIAKLRGLPWGATQNEILKFFDDCEVVNERDGVHIIMSKDNRPSGEAFVEFASANDLEKALKKDRCHMGSRYIEVFRSRPSQFEYAIQSQFTERDACVKLRGLPFHSTKDDIINFFKDLKIIPNGITMVKEGSGRASGEAFVQFASMEDADEALKKHREKIEYRYIEVFRSSLDDIRHYQDKMNYGSSNRSGASSRPGPYDRNSRSRYQSGGSRGGNNNMRYQNNGMGDWGSNNMRMSNMGSGVGPLMPRLNSGNLGGGNMGMRSSQNNSRYMGRGNDDWMDNGRGNSRGSFNNGSGDFRSRENFIHMRGLPFKARTCDIIDFFRPIVPIDVRINFEPNGRATGTADVEFECHDDALDAMTRDRQNMDNRYIELFLGSGPGKGRGDY
ncbi:heterogeneous nuclear ribonucleoprotein F-like isoform X2 [Ctenocephalides felis]|uniref:heterogeneous nuclear ribonucleoprotein F-like isoform X2 n=1 Tax=Ctenocephalides felis TaxID=7515 RepID=UPI000E6E197D|nr:heterogeneous nuclear ribonucleoprotein F-like isoform X2 [Ctenocephalides felis]